MYAIENAEMMKPSCSPLSPVSRRIAGSQRRHLSPFADISSDDIAYMLNYVFAPI